MQTQMNPQAYQAPGAYGVSSQYGSYAPQYPLPSAPPPPYMPSAQKPTPGSMIVGMANAQGANPAALNFEETDPTTKLLALPKHLPAGKKIGGFMPATTKAVNKFTSAIFSGKAILGLIVLASLAAIVLGVLSATGAISLSVAGIGAMFSGLTAAGIFGGSFFLGFVGVGALLLILMSLKVALAIRRSRTSSTIENSKCAKYVDGQTDGILNKLAKMGNLSSDHAMVRRFFETQRISSESELSRLKKILGEDILIAVRRNKSIEWVRDQYEKMGREF